MNQTGQIVWKEFRRYRRTVRNVEQEVFGMKGEVTIEGKRYLVVKGKRSRSEWLVAFEINKEE